MAASLEETNVTYEELTDLERQFEEAEVEIIRQQVALTKPLYEKRAKVVSQIPNFWPLVIEQAPPEIDQYIQPSDMAVLLGSLTSISVSHFEIENGGKGDPRSIAIKMEFSENEYFEDKVLEKKFWWRHAEHGWAGHVSEPVAIQWKEGKDLTQGILSMVLKVWEQEKKGGPNAGKRTIKPEDYSTEQKALKKKIEETGLGGVSFFTWFGFRGINVSAEESAKFLEKEKEQQKLRAEGKATEEEEEEEDEDEEDPYALEIFPDGDELAIAIDEELWPNAISYFTQAQEQEAMSDMDFEDDDEDDEDAMEEDDDEDEANGDNDRPTKKRKGDA